MKFKCDFLNFDISANARNNRF